MRTVGLVGTAVLSLAVVLSVALIRSDGAATPATAAGGAALSLGTITYDGTHLRVPIEVSGSGFDAYGGVTSVLLWDPAVFTFSSADTTGSVMPSPFCANGAASSSTGPHNGVNDGVNVGCATLASPTTATGLIVTIVLTPNSGCSPLHLLTLGPPDNDANGSGTQDGNGANQVNTYGAIDAVVDTAGAPCVRPTPTPALSTTPVATNTPAATSTPTSTNTPAPTSTPTSTNTPAPTSTPALTNTPAPTNTTGAGTATATPTSSAPDSDGDGYSDDLELSLGQDPFHYCVMMRADVNMDHKVDLTDLIIVSGTYGKSVPAAPARYDQNADGKITLSDLIIMSGVYSESVSACSQSTPTPAAATPTATNTPPPTNTPANTATATATPTTNSPLDSDGDGYPDALELLLGKNPFAYCPVMRADVSLVGTVTIADLILVAGWYGQSSPPAPARYDQNGDAKITTADLILQARVYNQTVLSCP